MHTHIHPIFSQQYNYMDEIMYLEMFAIWTYFGTQQMRHAHSDTLW